MRDNTVRRLTWGGLMRVLHRRTGRCFDHDHVRMVYPDGRYEYLNIKFDAQGIPYFAIVRERRNQ